jgi:protein-S-isoprenylcysteine O-methyltransferase Ste14
MRDEPAPGARPGSAALTFAWAGALLFGVSLAVFLFHYGTAWTRDVRGGFWGPLAADTGLFTLFALHHSLLARTGAKRRVTMVVPPWLERATYTWISSALFLVVCIGWQSVPGLLYSLPGAWRIGGYGLQAAGLCLIAEATSGLDALDLAGVRPVLNARRAEPARHTPLRTGGVYRLVRHPLYFGWVLLVFGAPRMTATRAAFAVVSTLYLAIAVPFEERSLAAGFGDAYGEYRRRTRWRMVPGIW